VPELKLQWVTACKAGPPEASKKLFAQAFSVCDVDPAHLLAADAVDTWDVICFEFDYPDMASLKLIPQAKRRWPSAPILMLTLQNSVDLALWALRSRVFDLLVKPVSAEDVERTVRRLQDALLARRTQGARRAQEGRARYPRRCALGRASRVRRVCKSRSRTWPSIIRSTFQKVKSRCCAACRRRAFAANSRRPSA